MKSMKNLIICPSIRPDLQKTMVESIAETSVDSDLVVDATPGSTTQIINRIFNSHPNYEFYTVTNDDFIFRTKEWDKILMESLKNGGVAYGNDLFQEENQATTFMVSGNIAKALGWLQYPKLNFLYGDTIWTLLARAANCLHYHPQVVIEHVHWENGKRTKDLVSCVTNSMAMYQSDRLEFCHWLDQQARLNIDTIREALNAG